MNHTRTCAARRAYQTAGREAPYDGARRQASARVRKEGAGTWTWTMSAG